MNMANLLNIITYLYLVYDISKQLTVLINNRMFILITITREFNYENQTN